MSCNRLQKECIVGDSVMKRPFMMLLGIFIFFFLFSCFLGEWLNTKHLLAYFSCCFHRLAVLWLVPMVAVFCFFCFFILFMFIRVLHSKSTKCKKGAVNGEKSERS